MRCALWLLAAALLIAPAAPAQEGKPANGIAWEADLEKAKKAAEEAGKPLLLYFTFDT